MEVHMKAVTRTPAEAITLADLNTVEQLAAKYPEILTVPSLRWALRHRDEPTGCVKFVQSGRTRMTRTWLTSIVSHSAASKSTCWKSIFPTPLTKFENSREGKGLVMKADDAYSCPAYLSDGVQFDSFEDFVAHEKMLNELRAHDVVREALESFGAGEEISFAVVERARLRVVEILNETLERDTARIAQRMKSESGEAPPHLASLVRHRHISDTTPARLREWFEGTRQQPPLAANCFPGWVLLGERWRAFKIEHPDAKPPVGYEAP